MATKTKKTDELVPTQTRPRNLAAFVDSVEKKGLLFFTREQAISALGVSDNAFKKAAIRLGAKKRIFSPRRGFFVIVPPEHRKIGALPPTWYIDDMMKYHGQPYYIGLLSAALFHGAKKHRPQEFQVITGAPVRLALSKKSRIRFFTKRHLEQSPVLEVKSPTGTVRISTVESTVIDLVRYMESVGHIGKIVEVLSELCPKLNGERLLQAAQAEVEISCIRRLGYLLDRAGGEQVSGPVANWLSEQRARPVALRPDRDSDNAPVDPKWLVQLNGTLDDTE